MEWIQLCENGNTPVFVQIIIFTSKLNVMGKLDIFYMNIEK